MKSIVQAFLSFISHPKRLSDEEFYYSQSSDIIELEYRMRQVQKGLAPFQNIAKSW